MFLHCRAAGFRLSGLRERDLGCRAFRRCVQEMSLRCSVLHAPRRHSTILFLPVLQ